MQIYSVPDSEVNETIEVLPAVKNAQIKDFGEEDVSSSEIPKWLDSDS